MRKSILFVVAAVLAISGCASSGLNFKSLNAGMSKDQVIQTMGQPDGFESQGNKEALLYANRFVNEWQGWDRADYVVILEGGKVVQYGPRQIRQDNQQRAPLLMWKL